MQRPTIIELRRFCADQRATTAIEYALIASGVAGAIIVTVGALGVSVTNMWTAIKDALG